MQRKAHSRGFWEHSLMSGIEKTTKETFFYFYFKHCTLQRCCCSEWLRLLGGLTFTSHHGTRLKALLARALEASHHVGAGSISTRVSDGALISVWRRVKARLTLVEEISIHLVKQKGQCNSVADVFISPQFSNQLK